MPAQTRAEIWLSGPGTRRCGSTAAGGRSHRIARRSQPCLATPEGIIIYQRPCLRLAKPMASGRTCESSHPATFKENAFHKFFRESARIGFGNRNPRGGKRVNTITTCCCLTLNFSRQLLFNVKRLMKRCSILLYVGIVLS